MVSVDGDPLLLTGLSEQVLSFTFALEDGGKYCFQNVLLFEPAKKTDSTRKFGGTR